MSCCYIRGRLESGVFLGNDRFLCSRGIMATTSLKATDSVLPHGYFSSSSVFLTAVVGRCINAL